MKNTVINLINEIDGLEILVNEYYSDSGYTSYIDELLAGKIKSLNFYFQQLGYEDLANFTNEYTTVRSGEAITILEFICGSVLPEALRKVNAFDKQNSSKKMRNIDRHRLIEKIGQHLQKAMTTVDINGYLASYGIENDGTTMADSKRVYTKKLLATVEDRIVIQIADDLGIDIPGEVIQGTIALQNLLNGTAYTHAKSDFEQALKDVETRPENAIGLASTTLESICKAILDSFYESYPQDESLQSLQKAVFNILQLSPEGRADGDIKRILGGLINVGAGIATLRTKYSSFHGKGKKQYRLSKRHARLAVNALTTTGLFLLETFDERFLEKL